MGNLADSLKRYFEETPQDELDRVWEELKPLNEIGPDASEYIERVRSYYGSVMLDDCNNKPFVHHTRESFLSNDGFYMAA